MLHKESTRIYMEKSNLEIAFSMPHQYWLARVENSMQKGVGESICQLIDRKDMSYHKSTILDLVTNEMII